VTASKAQNMAGEQNSKLQSRVLTLIEKVCQRWLAAHEKTRERGTANISKRGNVQYCRHTAQMSRRGGGELN
jgi:hypothetical protein